MKKIFLLLTMLLGFTISYAQEEAKEEKGGAQIKFDETLHDFGQFPEENPKVSCVFTFTNTGDKPLVIHQAVASCGCTAPTYTKEPVMPGEKGMLKVVYNGRGRYPGKFKKSIRIRTNADPSITTVYIQGEMLPKEVKAKDKK